MDDAANGGVGATTKPRHSGDAPEIAVVPERGRVTVRVDGVVIAESDSAVVLTEGRLPPRHYLPATDVHMGLLSRTSTSTH